MHPQNGTAPIGRPLASDAAAHGRRRGRRRAEIRSKIADSTIVQAVIAGSLSFTHIRDVANLAGQTGWKAWAYPLSVDLITVAAYRRLKRDQAAGATTGVAWTWFIIGLVFSLGANVADAIATAPAAADPAHLTMNVIIGMWPAAAFLGSTLLRHNDKPTLAPAAAERPTAAPVKPAPVKPATAKPTGQPAIRPATAIVQPLNGKPNTTSGPRPIAVKPTGQTTGQPSPFGDLGPRAATTGELPLPVWVQIGRPAYELLKSVGGDRPKERDLQAALTDEVRRLIADGALPAAVGQPSLSTAKRVRRAIEEHHPEIKQIAQRPQRLAIAGP